MLHITKARNTAYHPRSDGMVERINGTLETMISVNVQEIHRDWDKHLPYVMLRLSMKLQNVVQIC